MLSTTITTTTTTLVQSSSPMVNQTIYFNASTPAVLLLGDNVDNIPLSPFHFLELTRNDDLNKRKVVMIHEEELAWRELIHDLTFAFRHSIRRSMYIRTLFHDVDVDVMFPFTAEGPRNETEISMSRTFYEMITESAMSIFVPIEKKEVFLWKAAGVVVRSTGVNDMMLAAAKQAVSTQNVISVCTNLLGMSSQEMAFLFLTLLLSYWFVKWTMKWMIRLARLTKFIACNTARFVSVLLFLQWLKHQSPWTVYFCICVFGLYVFARYTKRQLQYLRPVSVTAMIKVILAVMVLLMIPFGYPMLASYLFGLYVAYYCMKGMIVSFGKWVYSWAKLLMQCGLLGIVVVFGIGIYNAVSLITSR
jgi:hypothetical protein